MNPVENIWTLVRPEPPVAPSDDVAADVAGDVAGAKPNMTSDVAVVADVAQPRSTTLANIDGAAFFDGIAKLLREYLSVPNDHYIAAMVAWAAHTHLADEFESTPRLAFLSPEKRCGKTRGLELLEPICRGTERLSDASPAYMFRRTEEGNVTIMLDEVDAIWRRGKTDDSAEALRSIVNAGHRQGGFVGRVQPDSKASGGFVLVQFKVYAPVALAGIGDLPETVLDRSVILRMRRRAPGERVKPLRAREYKPIGAALHNLLAAWADSVRAKVGNPWPTMPNGVTDRAADVWEPLLMVADLAGGQWPAKVRAACVALVAGAREESVSAGVRLLGDLRGAFDESPDQGCLSTQTLLARLYALEEAPWRTWFGSMLSPKELARLLKGFGVKPKQLRIGESVLRGYCRGDFADAWERYEVREDVAQSTALSDLQGVYENDHEDVSSGDLIMAEDLPGATPATRATSQVTPEIDVLQHPLQHALHAEVGANGHGPCGNAAHTPRLTFDGWTCPDCRAGVTS